MNEIEGVSIWHDWNGRCPDCSGEEFFEGPSGGLSVNIRCGKCGNWFNHSPFSLERIRWNPPEDCMIVSRGDEMFQPDSFSWIRKLWRR